MLGAKTTILHLHSTAVLLQLKFEEQIAGTVQIINSNDKNLINDLRGRLGTKFGRGWGRGGTKLNQPGPGLTGILEF